LLAAERRDIDTGAELPEAFVKFVIPEKIDAELFKTMFMECLALLGVISLAAILAIAFRAFLGKW